MAKAKSKKVTIEDVIIPIEEQPYEIPENWCWTSLSSVAEWGSGGTPSRKNPDYYEGNIPWIKTGELDDGYIFDSEEKITEDAVAHSSAKLFPTGSVLVAMYGATIGKTAILGIPATTNQACACARCNDTLDNKYLFYYLRSQKDSFIAKGKGGAQPNISQDIIKSHPIPLPPLAEQQRIVEQIESLFAKLDEAKEKIEEALDGFQIRKLSVLHNAFEGQLTKGWREKLGKTYTEYRKEKLQKLTSAIGDGLHGTPCFDECGEYYFINGNNFAGKSIEIKADTKTVNAEEFEKYKKNLSSENTVFVSINGTLGKTAFYNDEPIILGKSACYLNVLPVLNKCYLRYYFETEEFMQYANDKATGSTIKNLGLKAMRELQINIPPFDEQEEVVRLLDDVFSKENLAMEKANEVFEQIDLMKKSILAKAFRGELGANNPDEENAIELLKSILA